MSLFLQTLVQGITLGGIYALVALGMVLVYKSTKVLNIAHGAIITILAYSLYTLLSSMGLPLPIGILLVLVISALIGLCIERLVMRPLIGHGFLPMIMITLFIALLLEGIVTVAWADQDKTLVLIERELLSFWQISIQSSYLWSFIIALFIFLLLVALFRYTRIGLAMRAVAEDHQISQSMGIGVKRIFAISWALSCVTAATAGILLASNTAVVSPGTGAIGISIAIPVLLLGGMESVPGAFIGGLIIGITELFIGAYAGAVYRDIIPFALMLLILIIRPYGLFGLKRIERI